MICKAHAYIAFLFLLIILCSCVNDYSNKNNDVSPLHDSISVAIDKMQWDRCMSLIEEGEKTAENDIQRYDVLLLKGSAYYYFGKAKEMKALLDSISPEMGNLENGDSDEQAIYLRYIYVWMTYYAQYSDDAKLKISYAQKAKEYALRIKDYRNAVLAMSNLADIYRQLGDLNDAIMEYDEGIRLNDSIAADSMLYLPMYSGMACSFNVLRNQEETSKWLSKMLTMKDKMLTVDSIAYYTQKGNMLYFAGNYKESLKVFEQNDSLLQHHKDMKFDRIVCDVNIADNYIHQLDKCDDDKTGISYNSHIEQLLDNALAFFEKNGITAYAPYVHTLQILHLINNKEYSNALALAKKYMYEVPTMNPDHKVERYRVLSICMEMNHDTSGALKYNKIYQQLNDSLRNLQTIAMTTEVENRYTRDVHIKKQEIEIQAKELHELELSLAIVLIFIVMGSLAVVVSFYIRRIRHKNKIAVNRIIMLRGLIIRNRLTPHFISNALALGRKLSGDDLDHIILLIRESLSYDDSLTAPLEKELSFVLSYIRVASLIYNGEIEIDDDIDESIDLSKIDIPAMTLLSIVENAIKHGKKDDDGSLTIWIRISKSKDIVSIQITNPGTLSDYDKRHDKAWHGLKMISQMIELLNKKQSGKYSFCLEDTIDNHVVAKLNIKY